MLGITDKLLTVEKAVQLSRLETVIQVTIQLAFFKEGANLGCHPILLCVIVT